MLPQGHDPRATGAIDGIWYECDGMRKGYREVETGMRGVPKLARGPFRSLRPFEASIRTPSLSQVQGAFARSRPPGSLGTRSTFLDVEYRHPPALVKHILK